MGANKIKELWYFFLSQTKSVWVFILGNTWGNKMSKNLPPKRLSAKPKRSLKETPGRGHKFLGYSDRSDDEDSSQLTPSVSKYLAL
jgi:hypothetical protein